MTEFIDRLTKEEMGDLLNKFGFQPYGNGFRKGTQISTREGYKSYHTWNHDYYSSKDYDDEYIYISDFDVKYWWGDKDRNNKTLWNFMFNKFGKEWANAAIQHFANKNILKVEFIENLLDNEKSETPTL